MTRSRPLAGVVAIGATLLLLSACGGESGAEATTAGLEPSERTIHMAAVEPKGSASVDDEAFPTAALPDGGGYKLVEPDEEGIWTASTYMWAPQEIVVVEGDRVTLEIFGVNGGSHPSTIEGYGVDFEVKRGQLETVSFTADRPGIFPIVCHAHQPAMAGTLVVLPA